MTSTDSQATTFVWLHLTDRCQLECTHCATSSSPAGTHGTMTRDDWIRVLDEAAALGVRTVQFVGGEPTLYPHLVELIGHALSLTLAVEVFTNMVHISPALWEAFAQPGVSLATSYYSDDPDQHAAITQRPSYARTKANVAEAVRRGIPLRAGVIDLGGGQRAGEARDELVDLGVPSIGYDRVRELGRAAPDQQGSAPSLCGRCGDGVAAIRPDGTVTPCLFARWSTVGDVREESFLGIYARMSDARAELVAQGMPAPRGGCNPESTGENCWPYNCNPRG